MSKSEISNERASRKQYIYSFSGGSSEGDASMKNLLGGKGANLAEMANIGLPVPPGFTISTEVCTHYYDNQKNYPKNLFEQDIPNALHKIEDVLGKKFGDPENPLLVSVRYSINTNSGFTGSSKICQCFVLQG